MGAFDKFDLTGKSAVVTGGGTGIGYNIARALVTSGANVLICSRREDVLKDSVEKLNSDPDAKGEVSYKVFDLSDRTLIDELANHAIETFGGVDIFVGNAGQDLLGPIDTISDEVVDMSMQVNFSSNVALFRKFLPYMRQRKWGRVILSSSSASMACPCAEGMSAYAASKGAMNAYTRAAAAETGHDNITVNSLLLGVFMTKMLADVVAQVGEEFVRGYKEMTSLGRLAECEEVEGLIQLLASDAGSYITGACLAIDGGLTAMLKPNPISN